MSKRHKFAPYYQKPWYIRMFLSIKADLVAIKWFISCLIDYKRSIKGNDLTIGDTWGLAQSQGDVSIGRWLSYEEVFGRWVKYEQKT